MVPKQTHSSSSPHNSTSEAGAHVKQLSLDGMRWDANGKQSCALLPFSTPSQFHPSSSSYCTLYTCTCLPTDAVANSRPLSLNSIPHTKSLRPWCTGTLKEVRLTSAAGTGSGLASHDGWAVHGTVAGRRVGLTVTPLRRVYGSLLYHECAEDEDAAVVVSVLCSSDVQVRLRSRLGLRATPFSWLSV